MITPDLVRAHHLGLDGNGIAIGRGVAEHGIGPGIGHCAAKAFAEMGGMHGAQPGVRPGCAVDLRERRQVARLVARRIRMGHVLRSHGLTTRGMFRLRCRQPEKGQVAVHRGFSLDHVQRLLNRDSFKKALFTTCSPKETPPVTALDLTSLCAELRELKLLRQIGRIARICDGRAEVSGLVGVAALGDQVALKGPDGETLMGEIMRIDPDIVHVLPEGDLDGFTVLSPAVLSGPFRIAPCDAWIGRVIDSAGRPLDGRPLARGAVARSIHAAPPPAGQRRALGARLEAGVAVFNTLLPLVRGQRIGLFSGSGVGKSTLLGSFARHIEADVVVLALVGERGRELRSFAEDVLGPQGLARSVIVTETSDKSPLQRSRAALSAMAVAEHFRDSGKQVLLLIDSVSRHAEAYRELRLTLGEPASFRGYPPSLAHRLMALAERAGPGTDDMGDITAVFSVLVQGDDMQEPVADLLRGVLDGHTVLDRRIAERGRFPAVDLLRSVSRSLPAAAADDENPLILEARELLGAYDRAELMIQSGLYTSGADAKIDRAVACWPALDAFLAQTGPENVAESFARLRTILG